MKNFSISRHVGLACRLMRTNFDYTRDKFVIVTGADSSHYKSLHQFLSSVSLHEPSTTTIVYDLGLSESERKKIKDNFPQCIVKTFNFSNYPDYFNIKINAGEYAWKPVIINEVMNEYKCCICWLDAGNLLTRPLTKIRSILKAIGLYSPKSSGTVKDWTHPKTLNYLNASNSISHKNNLFGASVAVDYENTLAREVIEKWGKCAMEKECIAPEGSSRVNHRQDQAVLTVLAHQAALTKYMPIKCLGFKVHQDID